MYYQMQIEQRIFFFENIIQANSAIDQDTLYRMAC